MTFDPQMRDTYAHDVVVAHLDDDLAPRVIGCDAFTALAVTLAKAGGDNPADMGKVFDDVVSELDEGTVRWLTEHADTPAAFLQKRIAEREG